MDRTLPELCSVDKIFAGKCSKMFANLLFQVYKFVFFAKAEAIGAILLLQRTHFRRNRSNFFTGTKMFKV